MATKRFGGKMTLIFAGRKFEIIGNCELDTLGKSRDSKATASGKPYSTEEMLPGKLTVDILETISGPDFRDVFDLVDENLTLIEQTAKRMHVMPETEMTGTIKRDRKTGQVSGVEFSFPVDGYQETAL
ncbi:MAG: hypothetical protein J0I54_20695 [Bosea sp.]|uniref:hypothetical protein n=1 Tax=unclassified Bosea (in: a-proteobacteria) TaxID=2653178 RepID=UPI00096101A1|nr:MULTISPECIES: hypothetical protein [unclassified Bosea (in: a-proteobacteria)]MBN9459059.1 hypothetical protein [Bosea sp. (in: a-proteobacteria)]OJV06202.1 MAG: hypothetical protein BGO20_08060 [Bosea sp. 67-29]